MSDQSPKGSSHAFNLCGRVHSCHSRGTHPPLLRAPGRRDKLEEKEIRRGKWEAEGRERGRAAAAEKYSRFLQPPIPVSAGHDCDGKPETKTWRENPSLAGTALSASQKAALHYTSAFVSVGCGQKGDLATIHLCSQHDAAQRGSNLRPSCRNPPFLLKKPRSCTFAHSLYLLQWTFPHGEQRGDAGDACLTLNRAAMFDLHLLVCVKVWNETQADLWETMQPLMSPGGLGVTVFDTEHWGFL